MYPAAPASKARCTIWSDSCIVSTRILLPGTCADLTCDVDSVHLGHADIDYGYVRFHLYRLLCRLTSIRCLRNDAPAGAGMQHLPCTPPHRSVVVSEENVQFLHVPSPVRGIVTRMVVPWLPDSMSSRPPISFTRSCMLGMPTPTSNRGSSSPLGTLAEPPWSESLISKVRLELRSIRILAC